MGAVKSGFQGTWGVILAILVIVVVIAICCGGFFIFGAFVTPSP